VIESFVLSVRECERNRKRERGRAYFIEETERALFRGSMADSSIGGENAWLMPEELS
jgi:hypothetical protein